MGMTIDRGKYTIATSFPRPCVGTSPDALRPSGGADAILITSPPGAGVRRSDETSDFAIDPVAWRERRLAGPVLLSPRSAIVTQNV